MSNIKRFSSRKEVTEFLKEKGINTSNWSEEKWLRLNKGQAEIHMMMLSKKIYDAIQESVPTQLKQNEWHIPMVDKIPFVGNLTKNIDENNTYWKDFDEQNKVKISVALSARTSYTVVGEEKSIDYENMIELHDRLLSQDPPHSSPLEHCARAMDDGEYYSYLKTNGEVLDYTIDGENIYSQRSFGWCGPYKGFISYRHIIDNIKN